MQERSFATCVGIPVDLRGKSIQKVRRTGQAYRTKVPTVSCHGHVHHPWIPACIGLEAPSLADVAKRCKGGRTSAKYPVQTNSPADGAKPGPLEPMTAIGAIDDGMASWLGEAGTGQAGATSELLTALARKAKPNRDLRPARPVLARK